MKTKCTFGYIDEPQFRTIENREYIAHLLRSYRKQKDRYSLQRIGKGLYRVRAHKFDSAIAAITTK